MLNILSGEKYANVKAFEVADGVTFGQGEWAKFNASGKLVKAGSGETGAVFPVYAGNVDFYDTRYLGKVDVVTAVSAVLETDVTEGVTFTVGAPVYISANGKLTSQAATLEEGTDRVVGYVINAKTNVFDGRKTMANVVQFVRAN